MKLKSYIFRWVTLVTLLPATVLGLFATYYVQNLYHQKATDDIQRNLENISAEVSRSLLADQDLILKLADSKALKQFFPVLDLARKSKKHSDYDHKLAELSRFLEQYQSVIALFDTFRIMDIRGNTLLKVKAEREVITHYEGFDPYLIMDKEIINPEYIKLLSELPLNTISFIELPQTRDEFGSEYSRVIPDAVVPLLYEGKRVGYLAVIINGIHIDQLLELAARLYDGHLLIAEIDEENNLRNGQILYEDARLTFAQLKPSSEKIQAIDNGLIWDAFQKQSYGAIANPENNTHYYYMEYFPYPSSLASWVIVSEVQDKVFTSNFDRIRVGIWLLTGIAIISSLFLAHFASRSISTPILQLAEKLKTYADKTDANTLTAVNSNIDEIQESSESFTYMAKKLEQEQYERVKAEDRMVQSAKLASLGQMAAGIGHEINNPLNNIRSLSRLIRRDIDKNLQIDTHSTAINHSAAVKNTDLKTSLNNMLEDIRSLDEEVTRASDIVHGVLSFARQTPEKELKRINIIELLTTLDGLVKQEARRYKVRLTGIEMIQEHAAIMIMGDQGKLQQALVNILLNAIHANAEQHRHDKFITNSEIKFSLTTDNEEMTLSIYDQGAGIDEVIMDQIFDPFFTTKMIGQGTGLGLSISLGIIQNHSGCLNIKNAGEGGALVEIILPVCS
ncbi:MAG: hypothetical protein KZQ83_05020 [gamma proteobacterium symbiont of Taylorina sp.]|nr:hypothetical protein [gamma proteobacterium symbiont of Taylorina sp.]